MWTGVCWRRRIRCRICSCRSRSSGSGASSLRDCAFDPGREAIRRSVTGGQKRGCRWKERASSIRSAKAKGNGGSATCISPRRISGTLSRVQTKSCMSRVRGLTATSEGIGVEGLNILALSQRRLEADKIAIRKNDIHVFRDRRLPLVPGNKPLPMEGLERMPVSLRVGSVSLGSTFFTYEEYPKKGNETGLLKIYRLHGTLEPLINHPRAGDPAYLTMRMEGSLMNSGTVNATTKMPLHRGDPYKVEGVFHDLDVTTLNGPAENLGRLHLESGMLNSLDFEFNMTDEASTGRIIGEYHDLVVDKLKENTDEKKIAKFKSF